MTTPDPFSPDEASNYDADIVRQPTPLAPGFGVPVPPPPAPVPPAPGAPPPGAPTYPAPPAYAAYPPPPASTDGVSIAALVAGILGTGVVAVVLGIVGLGRTKNGVRSGRGMAWAGVILGGLGTLAWIVAILGFALIVTNIDEPYGSGVYPLPETSQTGTEYGSNAYLDALWDECEAGDMAACDDLFLDAPWGSEYEEFGDNCGTQGRSAFQLYCDVDSGE